MRESSGVTTHADCTDVLHPLSVEDHHRMIEVGILTEEDRVELLDVASLFDPG